MTDKFNSYWGNYLLKELVETNSPNDVSWWPQTQGWQIVLALIALFLFTKIYQSYKKYQTNAYRRNAIKWLSNLPNFIDIDKQPIYRQMPALLRQTAIKAFNRRQVCQLQKQQWEQWLDSHCEYTAFSENHRHLLHQLAYSPRPNISSAQMHLLTAEIALWIKFHRRQND